MNKEQFLKLVKIKGKLNFLNRLKAQMQSDPQATKTAQPCTQDYMKAAGQILDEHIVPALEEEERKKAMANADIKPNNSVSLSGEEFLQLATVAKSFYEKGRVENPPQFVIFMGGVASGKTTTRRHDYAEGYAHFDLAEIFAALKKAVGADNPKIGTYVDTVADMILEEAMGNKKNIVIEIIGDKYEATAPIIDKLTKFGYSVKIQSILADPVESYKRHLQAVKEDPDYLSASFTEEATLSHLNHHLV